jgi:hypothetical protein
MSREVVKQRASLYCLSENICRVAGGPCGDNYIDAPAMALNNERQSDVETDASKIVPFMYKNSSPAGLHALKQQVLSLLALLVQQYKY